MFVTLVLFSMDGADGMPMGAANSTLNMSHMDNSTSGLNQVQTLSLYRWSFR